MKKLMSILLVCLLVNITYAQKPFLFDIEEMSNIKSEIVPSAMQLAAQTSFQKNCILSGQNVYPKLNLQEKFIVFDHAGYRFTIYYQWELSSSGSIMDSHNCLTIYYRPLGTTDPESLKSFRDFYVNGSLDEYIAGKRCCYYICL